MRVEDIPLLVSVCDGYEPPDLGSLTFQTSRFPVPVFRELWIHAGRATISYRGNILSPQEIGERLRGYITKPEPEGVPQSAKHLVQALSDPFLTDLWIRVTGEVHADTGSVEDILVDAGLMQQHRGDMDLPVLGYGWWDFDLQAETIELEPKLTYKEVRRRRR